MAQIARTPESAAPAMGRRPSCPAAALAAAALFLLTAGAARASDWMIDFEAAEAESRSTGRPLLVHVYADWCGPCRAMESQTLGRPEVRQFLAAKVVAVKINADHRRDVLKRLGVTSLPSDVLIDAGGRTVYQSSGFKSAGDYVARLNGPADQSLAAFRPAAKPAPQERPQAAVAANTQGPPAGPLTAAKPVAAEASAGASVPVRTEYPPMLRGYSPVALHERREWTKGSREFAVEFRGQVYLMVSAEEKRLFEGEPLKYAPRLLGCDPIWFNEQDRAVMGDVQWGAFLGNDLYLFATVENRDRFKADPDRFVTTRVVSVEQIETVTR
jgi:thiol-disulfide isomerase/thioredoxin